MTTQEFSSAFDTVVDSYRRFKDFDKQEILDSIEFSEYEKSLYLTQSQDDVVISLYTGRNVTGEAFEGTEELRRYLDPLVTGTSCSSTSGVGVTTSSVFYRLPDDLLFIVYERARVIDHDLGCYDATETAVQPVTHDEYNRIRKNPFRGPTKYRVLRLDAGVGVVELVSKYDISGYFIKYLRQPSPIVLEDLSGEDVSVRGETSVSECELPEMLHDMILRRAVQLALSAKGIKANNQ